MSHINRMIKSTVLPVLLALCFAAGCSGGTGKPAGTAPAGTGAAEPVNTASSTEADSAEPAPLIAQQLISRADAGTVCITPDGKLYAVEGENKDGIFGDAPCEEKTIAADPSFMDLIDGDITVRYLQPGSAYLLDTDVKKACLFCAAQREYKYDGRYFESLIYVKNDGSVWLRGSNPNHMFGPFESAPQPVKLFENAVNVGEDGVSVAAVTAEGRLYAWDICMPSADGAPALIAENVSAESVHGGTAYITSAGEFYADTSRNLFRELHAGTPGLTEARPPEFAPKLAEDAGGFTLLANEAADFGGVAGELYCLQKDGSLTAYFGMMCEAVPYNVAENAAFAVFDQSYRYSAEYVDEFGDKDLRAHLIYIDASGQCFCAVQTGVGSFDKAKLSDGAAFAAVRFGLPVVIGTDGGLYLGAAYDGLEPEPAAEGVKLAAFCFEPQSLAYVDGDGLLYIYRTPWDGGASQGEVITLPRG